MSGPLVHLAAAEQCRSILNAQGIPFDIGRIIDIMEPDTKANHAGYNINSRTGNLFTVLEALYEEIRLLIKSANKNFNLINATSYNRALRYMLHYIQDTHIISQMSNDFSNLDTKFDIRTELTWNKKSFRLNYNLTFASKEAIKTAMIASMTSVYNTYRKNAKSYWFVVYSDIDNMCRNAVMCSSEFAAAYVRLALAQA